MKLLKFFASQYEIVAAMTIAIIAATLAVTDLFAGKYGDDEIIAANEKANMYQWYQAKSIKQGIIEGQRDLAKLLVDSGAIALERKAPIEHWIDSLNKDIERYKQEKTEILKGTQAIGGKSLVQKDGAVTGSKQWEARLAILGPAGDIFDMAIFYLQISLVLGAISIVLKNPYMQSTIYLLTIVFTIMGCYYSYSAFNFVAQLT